MFNLSIKNEAAKIEVLAILARESKSPIGATRRYARSGHVSVGCQIDKEYSTTDILLEQRHIIRYYNGVLVHEEYANN